MECVYKEPTRTWFVSDFQHGHGFVGYEAGTRICDLVRMGLLEVVGKFDRFTGYRLAEKPEIRIHKKHISEAEKARLMKAFVAGRSAPWMWSNEDLFEKYFNTL